jgi:hypothetical protein
VIKTTKIIGSKSEHPVFPLTLGRHHHPNRKRIFVMKSSVRISVETTAILRFSIVFVNPHPLGKIQDRA